MSETLARPASLCLSADHVPLHVFSHPSDLPHPFVLPHSLSFHIPLSSRIPLHIFPRPPPHPLASLYTSTRAPLPTNAGSSLLRGPQLLGDTPTLAPKRCKPPAAALGQACQVSARYRLTPRDASAKKGGTKPWRQSGGWGVVVRNTIVMTSSWCRPRAGRVPGAAAAVGARPEPPPAGRVARRGAAQRRAGPGAEPLPGALGPGQPPCQ